MAVADDLERRQQFVAEIIGAIARFGQSGERTKDILVAHGFAEVGFDAPYGDQCVRRNSIFLLNSGDRGLPFLDHPLPGLDSLGSYTKLNIVLDTDDDFRLVLGQIKDI